jgi:hypothetical protein
MGRLILILWHSRGLDPSYVGTHHMRKIQLGCVKRDRRNRFTECPESQDTNAYQIDPERKVQVQLIGTKSLVMEFTHFNFVLVGSVTSLLFVADVNAMTLRAWVGGSHLSNSSTVQRSKQIRSRYARTVTCGIESIAWRGPLASLSIDLH